MKSYFLLMGLFSLLFGCKKPEHYHLTNGVWYFKETAMPIQPGNDFKSINNTFAADDIHGFYRGEVIRESIGKTFTALNEHYAKDEKHVYYCDTYRKGEEYYYLKHNKVLMLKADPNHSKLL